MLSYRAGDALGRRLAARLRDPRRARGGQRQPHAHASRSRCATGTTPRRAARSRRRESMLTHFDRLAGWACAAFNDLLAARAGRRACAPGLPAVADAYDDEDRRVSATLREAVEAEPEEIHELGLRARHAAHRALGGAAQRDASKKRSASRSTSATTPTPSARSPAPSPAPSTARRASRRAGSRRCSARERRRRRRRRPPRRALRCAALSP